MSSIIFNWDKPTNFCTNFFSAVMRLGKRKEKEKDPAEVKSQGVDGITRLICLSKGQNPLKGIIKLKK